MSGPRVIPVVSSRIGDDPAVAELVRETRRQAAGFVFLSGGASKMSAESERALLELFGALGMLADDGVALAVGDGGTQAGIMQAAGQARKQSAHPFPLIGVSPAREVPPLGTTPLDPNHSVVVVVDNPEWDGSNGYFGSETGAMYRLFGMLAEGRPSVTVVANGGGIVLSEVNENVEDGRPMILVRGSGRATDALVAALDRSTPEDGEVADLQAKVRELNLTRTPALFHPFDIGRGPKAFAAVLRQFIAGR
jgi:hypothetical protein